MPSECRHLLMHLRAICSALEGVAEPDDSLQGEMADQNRHEILQTPFSRTTIHGRQLMRLSISSSKNIPMSHSQNSELLYLIALPILASQHRGRSHSPKHVDMRCTAEGQHQSEHRSNVREVPSERFDKRHFVKGKSDVAVTGGRELPRYPPRPSFSPGLAGHAPRCRTTLWMPNCQSHI